MGRQANYLIISDLQIPFEAKNALAFCRRIQKEFKIPKENIICVGDEVDQYFGSLYRHDPDALHTPGSEIQDSIRRLKEWYRAFPIMRVCRSNHGDRWIKKAMDAGIPSIMMRRYQEVIGAPKTWVWSNEWRIKVRHPFRVIHGVGYSGTLGHVNAAIDSGISTAIGHLHSCAGINYIRTSGQAIWAMNSGSLIDVDAYAFKYGQDSRRKPCLGTSVVVDKGATPIWIPLD